MLRTHEPEIPGRGRLQKFVTVLREAKEAVVSPEKSSMIRAKFLKVVQKEGETFASYLFRMRAALVDVEYMLRCTQCAHDNDYGENQL